MQSRKSGIFKKAFFIAIVCIIWQMVALSGAYPAMLFPPIVEIARSGYDATISGELPRQLFFSLVIISKGIALGSALSIALLCVSKTSALARDIVDTLISVLHPLPGIAVLPLVILWLGVGENSVLFVIVHSVLWPMLTNIMSGVDSISPVYIQTGENYGFTPFEMLREVYIPASMPSIISGLRISWARSWRALISSEMVFGAIGSTGGIGWFIFQKRVFMDTSGMYAGLFLIIIVGVLIEDIVFFALEKRTVEKWGMKS